MASKLKQLMKAGRADISAMLLIAFLFQILTPIVVLAGEKSLDGSFENALRTSICRVDVAAADEQSPAQPAHTDGFVCDWCVLCSADIKTDSALLPEVVTSHPLSGLPQSIEGVDNGQFALDIQARPSAPRAPPYV
ncbi:DUF2946 family protein [Terasakiella sp. A23]|uniref:DUF2946 family protein n=1 Tax=Terasakiella sp. FCG-A23 TaxID=3080561 RepID=UPI00295493E2|nr:DUF2946 family protein [Terasakiella sp. A23]MDV7339958.1 DUF2946 family protein [Terasakiella sp. A23]